MDNFDHILFYLNKEKSNTIITEPLEFLIIEKDILDKIKSKSSSDLLKLYNFLNLPATFDYIISECLEDFNSFNMISKKNLYLEFLINTNILKINQNKKLNKHIIIKSLKLFEFSVRDINITILEDKVNFRHIVNSIKESKVEIDKKICEKILLRNAIGILASNISLLKLNGENKEVIIKLDYLINIIITYKLKFL